MDAIKDMFALMGFCVTVCILILAVAVIVENCRDRIRLRQLKRMGYWKRIGADTYECSKCGQMVMTRDILAYKYCHGCGEEMKGVE